MKQFSALDVYKWISTQGELVKTARISQIYRHDIMQITLALHTKEGKRFLVIQPPRNLFLTQSQPGTDHKETGFGTYMRQNLKGVIIKDIIQIRSERILQFKLPRGNLYIELFNKGNIIITNEDNIIESILQKQIYKDRELKKGEVYNTPTSFDTLHANKAEFTAHMDLHKDLESISLFFATRCGLGGKNAEIVCKKMGISPDTTMPEVDQDLAYEKFQELLNEETSFEDVEKEYFEGEKEEVQSGVSKEILKIDKIIQAQKKTLEDNEKKAEKNNQMGEFIYENYQFFEEAKVLYQNNELTNETLQELAKKYGVTKKMTYKKPEIIFNE